MKSGENEGIRVLDDFVCQAIQLPAVAQASPTQQGQNEGPGETRDTPYATELCHGSIIFPSGSEGRIERLRFKQPPEEGKEGIRFSWWKEGRMVPRPLDTTEDQLLKLLTNALQQGVFSPQFLTELRKVLGNKE